MKEEDFMDDDFLDDDFLSEPYKVGDTYCLMSLGYFLHLEAGGDEDDYPEDKQYCECTIKYMTPEGGFILEAPERSVGYYDGTFDTCRFSGKEIKAEYPDFDGDDDADYIVPYYDGCPFC